MSVCLCVYVCVCVCSTCKCDCFVDPFVGCILDHDVK